jgi:hypothetical protein
MREAIESLLVVIVTGALIVVMSVIAGTMYQPGVGALLFVYCTICAAIGTRLGNMRDRGQEGCFFGGLLGVPGWYLVLLMPDKERVQEVRVVGGGLDHGNEPTQVPTAEVALPGSKLTHGAVARKVV